GILNGTTNYVLTRMSQAGLTYPAALKEAQNAGFAEADPTFDVEGIDAAHKIAILASIARSEEHTSELQSRVELVCRLLLENKKTWPGNRDLASSRSRTGSFRLGR